MTMRGTRRASGMMLDSRGFIGKNLFNKSTAVVSSFVLRDSGGVAVDDRFFRSDYIKVQPSTEYTQNFASQSAVAGCAFYDSAYVYISGFNIDTIKTYTTPANCVYLRTTAKYILGATLDNFQLELGSTATAYSPYNASALNANSLVDRSSHRNNGAFSGTTWSQLASGAWVMDFTAVANLVTIPAAASINNMSQFSFAGWIKYVGAGGNNVGRIFSKTNNNEMIVDYLDNRIAFYRIFSTSAGGWNSPTNSLEINKYYFIQISYDSTSVANDPVIAINGISVAITEILTPVGVASSDSAGDLILGNSSAAIRFLNGYMSPPKIYNYLRTNAQALAAYTAEKWFYGI